MSTTATELIHSESIGNIDECRRISDIIYPRLKQMYETKEVMGYSIDVIKDQEQADFHLIDNAYLNITHGTFPFLYVAVQPNEDDRDFDNKISFLNEGYNKIISS